MHACFKAAGILISVSALAGCSEALYETKTQFSDYPDLRYVTAYATKAKTVATVSIVPGKEGNPPTPPTAAVKILQRPIETGYLYLRPNPLYTTTADFAVSELGIPTKSDTMSSQQLTASLSELAQTAAAISARFVAQETPPASLPEACGQEIKANAPFYKKIDLPIENDAGALINTSDSVKIYLAVDFPKREDGITSFGDVKGFVTYEPSPAIVSINCTASRWPGRVLVLNEPQLVNILMTRRIVSPKRDFLTSPQDTYTLTNGVITEHRYVDQSAFKNVVDLITQPIRSALPSVSTQVTVGGGKPDQTQTTYSPPKP